jgi:hypothetical protein
MARRAARCERNVPRYSSERFRATQQLAMIPENEVATLTARITVMTDARTEAERALQAAQASVAESDRESTRSADEAMPSPVNWHRPVRNSTRANQPPKLRTGQCKRPKLWPSSTSKWASDSASEVKFLPASWHRSKRKSKL